MSPQGEVTPPPVTLVEVSGNSSSFQGQQGQCAVHPFVTLLLPISTKSSLRSPVNTAAQVTQVVHIHVASSDTGGHPGASQRKFLITSCGQDHPVSELVWRCLFLILLFPRGGLERCFRLSAGRLHSCSCPSAWLCAVRRRARPRSAGPGASEAAVEKWSSLWGFDTSLLLLCTWRPGLHASDYRGSLGPASQILKHLSARTPKGSVGSPSVIGSGCLPPESLCSLLVAKTGEGGHTK